jgi:hypothetical protein
MISMQCRQFFLTLMEFTQQQCQVLQNISLRRTGGLICHQ